MPPRLRNPCSFLNRRLQIVASLTAFVLLCIVFLGSAGKNELVEKVPYGPQLQLGAHRAVEDVQHAAHHINPFGTPAHKPPPEQANSSSGDSRWYSDWKWRNPFSSTVTLDEERAVLPPLNNRPPIYTYYDLSTRRKDSKSRKAEQELLQIWRRAWWAQGFKPVVLSKSEAMNNPLFRRVQVMELDNALENELMRWLAWEHMGTGILSQFMTLPMARYEDPLLAFLRRGDYPALTRYKGLGNGLLVGSKANIEAALKEAIKSPALKRVKCIDEALLPDTFRIDSPRDAIAFYSDGIVRAKYSSIKEKLENPTTVGDGLAMLPALINGHVHQTWQSNFPKGIAVLKPLAQYTTGMIKPAVDIALKLTECPITPIPGSCPPNNPKCKPCVSSAARISTSKVYKNDSALFTVATVPHPYTIQSLAMSREEMDLRFIRRETVRDLWIRAATQELLGTGISAFARLPSFKDAVASEHGIATSLWVTAEQPCSTETEKDLENLDWMFGFQLPREPNLSGKSETPVPGPERRPPKPPEPEYGDGPVPTQAELKAQQTLLDKAKTFVQNAGKADDKKAKQTRNQIEAWNLADSEAWKFVRAFDARRMIERQQWEDSERAFLGKGTLNRWHDAIPWGT